MTLEKLQKIATTPVNGKYIEKWLKWWNLSPITHEALYFLSLNFINNDLEFVVGKNIILGLGNIINYNYKCIYAYENIIIII